MKGVENTLFDKKDWFEKIAGRLFIWFEKRAKVSVFSIYNFDG